METYAQYAPVRKATMEIIRQRNLTLAALISSYDAYEDLIAKSSKGQEFYRKLETNVTKLLQRVKGTCKVQQEERDTILAKNGKTLPSKAKQTPKAPVSQPTHETNPPSSAPSGPKLKDYLDNYKKDKSAYGVQNPGGSINDMYYNAPTLPTSTGYAADSVSAPYDSSQPWVPSVRPAPVGQEGTCPAATSQDLKLESNYPTYSTNVSNKPFVSDPTHYQQMYADQYASYMAQYQQYPITSSPYHMPPSYAKSDVPAYPKGVSHNTPSLAKYPSNTPSPQVQGTMPMNPPPYPSPAPSPGGPSYQPPPYEAYKPPTTVPQAYIAPTPISQSYNTPTYRANLQYANQSYPTNQPLNANYSSQVGQNSIPQENYSNYVIPATQTYQTQNIPSVQTYPSNSASPLHNYTSINPVPVANIPQSPYTSTQTYQTPITTYSQPSNIPSLHQNSIDQNITNNFNVIQSKQVAATTTAYSTLSSLTYPLPSQDQQIGGQQPYPQFNNATNSNQTFTNPSASPAVTQSDPMPQHQYSSYIPQNYTGYVNSQTNHTGQPWLNTYDTKTVQPQLNYHSTNQYPNYSQVGVEMQYTPTAGSSCYTHAGQVGSQTSSSLAQPTTQAGQPNYTQGNYYYLPYGYQYTSGTTQCIMSPSSSPQVLPAQVNTQQGQITPQSPMTYMQASTSNLKLTFSQDQVSSPSNVDLLAGLDFSLSQDPLVPQQNKVEPSMKPVPSATTSLEEKLETVTISEIATVSATPDAVTMPLPSGQITFTPKKVG